MNKITTLNGAIRFSKYAQKSGKTVGLVVGSFDILHLGHINLFRFAKKHADVLIIGLDNDKTIRLVKGNHRPVNNFKRRSELLSDLKTVDKIFEIKTVSHNDSEEAVMFFRKLVEKILPTHIFTHKTCDKHWRKKKQIAKEVGTNFLLDKSKKVTTSGAIIEILSSEL